MGMRRWLPALVYPSTAVACVGRTPQTSLAVPVTVIAVLCALAAWVAYLLVSTRRAQRATPPAPPKPGRSYALAVLALSFGLGLGLFGEYYLAALQPVFESFGAPTHGLASLMFRGRAGFWIPGLMALGLFVGYKKSRQYPAIFGAVCLLQLMLFVSAMWIASLSIDPLC